MLQLSPDECRVLGVLVEKAQTTPAQYPLTLNAVVVGANQKNNRHPVTNLDEDRALDAIDALRAKGLVREAMLSGSRVSKFRHLAREVLQVETPALVILTELLLRGPQSPGDLRANASRMHPLESLDAVQAILDELRSRPEPLVKEIPPAPGQRARRYVQLLCPALHPLDAAHPSAHANTDPGDEPPARSVHAADSDLRARVEALEAEVAALKDTLRALTG